MNTNIIDKSLYDMSPKMSGMISKNDTIIVGLSGGADSVALTHFLCKLSPIYNLSIIACHINHGIRGEESDLDQKFVQDYCKKLCILLEEVKVNLTEIACDRKKSIEECGRDVRYKFFDQCAKKYHAKIATAHTLSDSIETVLLNFIRGTGLKGLCGIPASRDNIIRPFIEFTRGDVELYCKQNNLDFVTDSSNLSHDYTRNLIRHKIIPVIAEINSNYASTIGRCCDIILEDEKYITDKVEEFLIQNADEKNGYNICSIRQLPDNIKNRVIKGILKDNNLEYSANKINIISNFIDGTLNGSDLNQSKLMLTSDVYLVKSDRWVKIENSSSKIDLPNFNYEVDLKVREHVINGKSMIFDIVDYDFVREKIKSDINVLKFCVDYDKIKGKLIIRKRKDGDSIKLEYRKHTKSLKKLFNEKAMSQYEKDSTLIISDDEGVIWVENFGSDHRVAVSDITKTVIFISLDNSE